MLRCKICDFSPDAPSLYHSSLSMPKDIKMSLDPETGELTCNCFDTEVEYNEDWEQGDDNDVIC